MTVFSRLLPIALYGAHSALAQVDAIPESSSPPADSNPLTWGFYATHEVLEPTQLDIEGTIPPWLTGSLYRGAAATWDAGNYTAEHWFDGFSRNHRFEIADGAVTYRSRNSSDELADFVRETGKFPGGSFAGDPCKVIFGAFETTFRDGNNTVGDKSKANIGVSYVPNFPGLGRNTTEELDAPFNTLVVTTDGNRLLQINPETLEGIELFTYQASHPLLGGRTSAAHPAHGDDGTLYQYALDTDTKPPTYRIFSMLPTGETEILANITDAPAAYIHSVFNTENHIIFIVWQADIVRKAFNFLDSIGTWNPDRHTLFYVIDRVNGGIIRKYEASHAFFAFHQINSFEDEQGDIIIDLPRFNDTGFLQASRLENLRANLGSPNATAKHDVGTNFARYRLPYHEPSSCGSSNGTIVTHPAEVDFVLPYKSANIELPRINPNYHGKAYRYAYGIHVENTGYFADSIIKVDVKEEDWKVWTPDTKHLPSEPIFVQKPGSTKEDEGVLMTVAMDAEARRSSLVFINAESMIELARARMPIVMGYGFHGAWGSNSQYEG